MASQGELCGRTSLDVVRSLQGRKGCGLVSLPGMFEDGTLVLVGVK